MIVDRVNRTISGKRVEVAVLYGDSDPPYSWIADCPVGQSCPKLSPRGKTKGSKGDAVADAVRQIEAHLKDKHKTGKR